MNLVYETNDTLMHYGIPGMRWGKRKARIVGTDKHRNRGLDDPNKLLKSKKYVTAYQAQKNATKAANEARKKSIAESRASGDKGVGSFARANRKALNAKRKVYGESINKDKAHNKQIRVEKKMSKGKILTKGIVSAIGVRAVSNIASGALIQAGKRSTAMTINAIGTLTMGAVVGSSVSQAIKTDK